MQEKKSIGLVAHDARKPDLLDWAVRHKRTLAKHTLFATGTSGRLIVERTGLPVTLLKSGPLGGDQQMGALIAEGRIDVLIFFVDPMSPMPHDVDVKALVRLSTVYHVAMAMNRTTADFLIRSPLFARAYQPEPGGYGAYVDRVLKPE